MQLGAIGTTYVKEHMIKVVMGSIMLIVAVSRGLAIPTYLKDLDLLTISDSTAKILMTASFLSMCFALGMGALIILGSMWRAKRAETAKKAETGFRKELWLSTAKKFRGGGQRPPPLFFSQNHSFNLHISLKSASFLVRMRQLTPSPFHETNFSCT